MYFVPHKGRLYRWAVYTRPMIRYTVSLALGGILFGIYYFLMQPWIVGAIEMKQATLNRTQQQNIDMTAMNRGLQQLRQHIDTHSAQIKEIADKYSEKEQHFFLFNAAEKAGLSLQSFVNAHEKQKDWKQKKYKLIRANGSFDQCCRFLEQLSQNVPLLQCKNLSLQRADQTNCSLQAEIAFVKKSD